MQIYAAMNETPDKSMISYYSDRVQKIDSSTRRFHFMPLVITTCTHLCYKNESDTQKQGKHYASTVNMKLESLRRAGAGFCFFEQARLAFVLSKANGLLAVALYCIYC